MAGISVCSHAYDVMDVNKNNLLQNKNSTILFVVKMILNKKKKLAAKSQKTKTATVVFLYEPY